MGTIGGNSFYWPNHWDAAETWRIIYNILKIKVTQEAFLENHFKGFEIKMSVKFSEMKWIKPVRLKISELGGNFE